MLSQTLEKVSTCLQIWPALLLHLSLLQGKLMANMCSGPCAAGGEGDPTGAAEQLGACICVVICIGELLVLGGCFLQINVGQGAGCPQELPSCVQTSQMGEAEGAAVTSGSPRGA